MRLKAVVAASLVFSFLFVIGIPSESIGVERPISDSDRDHWSFKPIKSPRLPEVSSASWPKNEIDYFILRKLEQKKLLPLPPADRATLLRRLKFDLLGLPPTSDEVLAFEQDQSRDAYAELVDRFLESPAYGERWAQHWLDLARFAETDGFEHDKVRDNAWKYRQWVIDALNADMPYDRFVRLQLTGDLTGRDEDAMATMFCMAGPDMPDINEQDLRRHDKMNEITSTVGAVLLGLQMHCCQCHDHKYDPISIEDFYRLRGIFESAVPELKRDKPVGQLTQLGKAVTPFVYQRGELGGVGAKCTPGTPRIASLQDSQERFDEKNTREAFADWLFAEENPLTARVIANRIWLYHFGKSLCENPSDFGVITDEPTHPKLLEWLATELIRKEWKIKELHRAILLSATYQQASNPNSSDKSAMATFELSLLADRENERYSRFPRQRLEGEAIRDAMLSVSGQLNSEFGGPSVRPPLPAELVSTLLKGQWKASEEPKDHTRRSIYIFARRNLRYPIFDAFDRPDAGASCARRDRSTTAIQALQMLNSELAFQSATKLRDRILEEHNEKENPSSAELIERLFLTAFARHATEREIQKLTELIESDPEKIEENLLTICVSMMNASEFIYID